MVNSSSSSAGMRETSHKIINHIICVCVVKRAKRVEPPIMYIVEKREMHNKIINHVSVEKRDTAVLTIKPSKHQPCFRVENREMDHQGIKSSAMCGEK